MATPAIDIRPAAGRARTDLGWLDSHHSFSFGHHHDPTNTGHGLLIVSNDDHVGPGGGFSPHSHRDMEIVTWVLSGRLEHRDSAGHHGIIHRGLAQRMSAGSGITHSETNHSRTEAVHFVQMWVPPDITGIAPEYEQLDVSAALDTRGLVPVASGMGHEGAITIHQAAAAMWVGRLGAGHSTSVPDAPYVHVFVASGSLHLADRYLGPGDAARLTDAGPATIAVAEDAEVIIWESHREAQR